MPTVSIVTASRNETAMLCMTVLSAVEALKAENIDGEVIVVENSEPDIHEAAKDCIAGAVKEGTVRVVRQEEPSIAKALQRAHDEAKGEFIFYTDAHTMIGANTLRPMVQFFRDNADKRVAFLHAPIQWAHRSSATKRTHMNVNTSKLGEWSGAVPVTHPQRVPWKGMPYMIPREVWHDIGGYGCCAEHSLGWGVLAYLGMKPWMLGYENWAIPEGVVYHFGEWPERVRPHARYRTYNDGGYHPGLARAVAFYVFGGEETLRAEYASSQLHRYFKSEDEAVRLAESIGSTERQQFLLRQTRSFKDLFLYPPWEDRLETISPEYLKLNAGLHMDSSVLYGYKGHEQAASVLALADAHSCESVLDYGAGKRTLSQRLKVDRPDLQVRDYDPAISEISAPPSPADMVVCSDVLEHVEPEKLEAVLGHLRSLARKVLFVRVCTVPCLSKKLPDGSDPHRIVQPLEWWVKQFHGFKVERELEHGDKYFALSLIPD